jgi:predicted transcriptional regulator
MPEAYHLRVRLDDNLRKKLLEVSSQRGKGETLSDMVRQAIAAYLAPTSGVPEKVNVGLDEATFANVQKLAEQLDRQPVQVVEDCIQGIVDIFETGEPSLIILELQLRRKYYGNEFRPK